MLQVSIMLTLDQASHAAIGKSGAILGRRLALAAELAISGLEPAGRDLCAAIFLEHALLLSTNPSALRQLVECLLLLRMESLLQRAIRALYGFDPKRTVLTPEGEQRTFFVFPSGTTLSIPWSDAGHDLTKRRDFATAWSHRILAELGPVDRSTPKVMDELKVRPSKCQPRQRLEVANIITTACLVAEVVR